VSIEAPVSLGASMKIITQDKQPDTDNLDAQWFGNLVRSVCCCYLFSFIYSLCLQFLPANRKDVLQLLDAVCQFVTNDSTILLFRDYQYSPVAQLFRNTFSDNFFAVDNTNVVCFSILQNLHL
jgi:hypothetical protein